MNPRIAMRAAGAAMLILTGSAGAQTLDPAPIIIHGVVENADGKPAPDATVFLLSLPDADYPPNVGFRGQVTSDSQGRFVWDVPADLADQVKAALTVQITGQSSLPAYWLPEGAPWKVTAQLPPMPPSVAQNAQMQQQEQEQDISYLYQQATIPCKTIYPKAWNDPELDVVLPEAGAGTIQLQLRDPNGKLLAHHPVQLYFASDFSMGNGKLLYHGATDGAGRLTLPWPAGLCRLAIVVPGVGFGATGMLDVQSNRVIEAYAPPLAPWATVAGSVAPVLRHPGETVKLQVVDEFPSQDVSASPVDAQGRFMLNDLPPGNYTLQLHGATGAPMILQQPNIITCVPGEHLQGVRLFSPSPSPPLPAHSVSAGPMVTFNPFGPNNSLPTVISGRVTTADGKPVAGASVWAVYAISNFNGTGTCSKTTTDANGDYRIDKLRPDINGATIYAYAQGDPAATAIASNASETHSPDAASDLTANLIIPDAQTRLTVHVQRNGLPAGAGVAVQAMGSASHANFVQSSPADASNSLRALLEPTVKTDLTGTATFTNLTPGLWNITAGTDDKGAYSFQAKDIAVSQEAPAAITVNLLPPPPQQAFKALWPDGSAWNGSNFNYLSGVGGGPLNSGTGEGGITNGIIPFYNEQIGIQQVKPVLRRGNTEGFYGDPEPYDGAEGLLAISPSLPGGPPLVLRTARVKPARILIFLIGPKRQYLRGAVTSPLTPFASLPMAGSSGTSGVVVFPDVPSGSCTLCANIYGVPPPPLLGQGDDPWPSEQSFSNVLEVEPQTVTVTPNTTLTMTMQQQRMGYLTGRVVGLSGANEYCDLSFTTGNNTPFDPGAPPTSRVNDQTGQYVLGPIPPGKAEITAAWYSPSAPGSLPQRWIRTFHAIIPLSGGVVHMDVAAPTQADRFVDDSPRRIAGTVYLSDGKTPAWGAMAVVLRPNFPEPSESAQADARGQLAPSSNNYFFSDWQTAVPAGGVTSPTLVVWLPGSSGAAIMPYDPSANPRIVLPPARTLTGQVTVGGKSVAGLLSGFEIEAQPEGMGQLDALLSVTTTAQADGTFSLPLLVPGQYLVQAARDRIWLSGSQTIITPLSADPAPLTLDIPPIGQSAILHVQDAQGKPLPLLYAGLPQPPGPLTSRYWPATVFTDGAGNLTLPGLSPGSQELDIPAASPTAPPIALTFTVSPLDAAPSAVQTLTVPANAP